MSLRILVVDDYKLARTMLTSALDKLGYKDVWQASNGSEAWEILKKLAAENTPIDLVFCDWNMPVMTGIELLQKLRQTPPFKELPFIMATVESDASSLERALALGAADYLLKPFSMPILEHKIKRVVTQVEEDTKSRLKIG